MWVRFTSHLYVRIWLAVVATVMVLIFLVGAAWRLSRDPPQLPIREVLLHNHAGDVIGTAQTKADRQRGDDLEFDILTRDGQTLNILLPRPKPPPGGNPWERPNFGLTFGWMLMVVGVAVALGAYPIMRRLTLRLEALQRGVERWGAGDLSARVNTSGSDEIAFLAERFNNAAERIETLMESHKSLLANASHELRSPLARIQMSLELMPLARSSPQRMEISRSITELDQLIDEILLASRLDAKQADAEPFETLDLTGLAAEECARTNAELSAELAADAGDARTTSGNTTSAHSLTVQGSPRLLRRLIRNLLENARRYGGDEVEVEVQVLQQDTQIELRVCDRGPGVPEAHRQRIFEAFFRLPGHAEREGGVGLGLSLVRQIAERHGGSVRCEAREGGGSCFVLQLPAPTPATSPRADRPGASATAGKR